MIADNNFTRDEIDANADYIVCFLKKYENIELPKADILDIEPLQCITLGGVILKPDVSFQNLSVTKTSKVRVGRASLRYSKNNPLRMDAALWQSVITYSYLIDTRINPEQETEQQICRNIDAGIGRPYFGPTDSKSRFENAEVAWETIAQQWHRIPDPPGAVF